MSRLSSYGGAGSSTVLNVRDAGAAGDDRASDTAIIAACLNAGGAIYFPDGTYQSTAALTPHSSTLIYGETRDNTILHITASDAGVKSPNPSVQQRAVMIHTMTIWSSITTPIGIDGRGFTRMTVDDTVITGFGQDIHAAWDNGAYATGWTNLLTNSELSASMTPFYFADSGNWEVHKCVITPSNVAGAIGVDMVGPCDQNNFYDCDISYAPLATAIHLRTGAQSSNFVGCRFEDIASDPSVTVYPVMIDAGASYHTFIGPSFTNLCRQPWVYEADPTAGFNTVIGARLAYGGSDKLGASEFAEFQASGAWHVGQDALFRRGVTVIGPPGTPVFQTRQTTDPHIRMDLTNNGTFDWYDSSSGAWRVSLGLTSQGNGIVGVMMSDATHGGLAMGATATLPAASASWAGVILLLQGGAGTADRAYICLKNPAGTYTWNLFATGV